MENLSTEELNQIQEGLLHRYTVMQEMISSTRDIPDVCAHWQKSLDAINSAYLKVQKALLKSQSEDLRKKLGL